MSADTRLASYGTLAPGEENYKQVEKLSGEWFQGTVRGHRVKQGWGTWVGFPGLILDPGGEEVTVQIFESDDLPAHWDRLDAFEGDEYHRVPTIAHTERGPIEVSIYAIRNSSK